MGTANWFDSLIDNWPGILLGVMVGIGLQVVLAILMISAGLSMEGTATLILAELSVGLAGFVTAWFAEKTSLVSSLAVAIICAFISLIASAFANPLGINLLGVLILLGGYSLMGGLGGFAAKWVKGRKERREFERW